MRACLPGLGALLVGLLCGPGALAAQGLVLEVRSAPAMQLALREHWNNPCRIDLAQQLGATVHRALQRRKLNVLPIRHSGEQVDVPVLTLELVDLVALGDGGWLDRRMLTLQASVTRNRELLEAWTISRRTPKNLILLTPPCAPMEKVLHNAGAEVAVWYLSRQQSGFEGDRQAARPPLALWAAVGAEDRTGLTQDCTTGDLLGPPQLAALRRFYPTVERVTEPGAAEGPLLKLARPVLDRRSEAGVNPALALRASAELFEHGQRVDTVELQTLSEAGGILGQAQDQACALLQTLSADLAAQATLWLLGREHRQRSDPGVETRP